MDSRARAGEQDQQIRAIFVWMGAGLIIGLLLIVLGSVASLFSQAVGQDVPRDEPKSRYSLKLLLPMLATLLGAVFTIWQLVEDNRENAATQKRTNEIIDSLAIVNRNSRIALEQQQWIADTTCKSIGVSIEKLEEQSEDMKLQANGLKLQTKLVGEQGERLEKALAQLYDVTIGSDSVYVNYVFQIRDTAITKGLGPIFSPMFNYMYGVLDDETDLVITQEKLGKLKLQNAYTDWLIGELMGKFLRVEFVNDKGRSQYDLRSDHIGMYYFNLHDGVPTVTIKTRSAWREGEWNKSLGRGSMYSLIGLKPIVTTEYENECICDLRVHEMGWSFDTLHMVDIELDRGLELLSVRVIHPSESYAVDEPLHYHHSGGRRLFYAGQAIDSVLRVVKVPYW